MYFTDSICLCPYKEFSHRCDGKSLLPPPRALTEADVNELEELVFMFARLRLPFAVIEDKVVAQGSAGEEDLRGCRNPKRRATAPHHAWYKPRCVTIGPN